jgi:hypothetical protein
MFVTWRQQSARIGICKESGHSSTGYMPFNICQMTDAVHPIGNSNAKRVPTSTDYFHFPLTFGLSAVGELVTGSIIGWPSETWSRCRAPHFTSAIPANPLSWIQGSPGSRYPQNGILPLLDTTYFLAWCATAHIVAGILFCVYNS